MLSNNKHIRRICLYAMLLITMCSYSQEKQCELNVRMLVGSNFEKNYYDGYNKLNNETHSIFLGIGLRYYIKKNWAIEPELGYLFHDDFYINDIHDGGKIMNNEESDNSDYIYMSVLGQYIFKPWKSKKHKIIVGIGPSLYINVKSEKYKYCDGEWTVFEEPGSYYSLRREELDGKRKIKALGMGVQLGVSYRIKHFQFGIIGNLCLSDMNKDYNGINNGTRRFKESWLELSYYF